MCLDVPDGEGDGGKESDVEFHCGCSVAVGVEVCMLVSNILVLEFLGHPAPPSHI